MLYWKCWNRKVKELMQNKRITISPTCSIDKDCQTIEEILPALTGKIFLFAANSRWWLMFICKHHVEPAPIKIHVYATWIMAQEGDFQDAQGWLCTAAVCSSQKIPMLIDVCRWQTGDRSPGDLKVIKWCSHRRKPLECCRCSNPRQKLGTALAVVARYPSIFIEVAAMTKAILVAAVTYFIGYKAKWWNTMDEGLQEGWIKQDPQHNQHDAVIVLMWSCFPRWCCNDDTGTAKMLKIQQLF